MNNIVLIFFLGLFIVFGAIFKSDSKKPANKPLANSQISQDNISFFIYPNSELISMEQNLINLQSGDDPDIIANWYKGKITELNLNIKTFVKTNANNNISDILTGTDKAKEITVKIEKKQEDNVSKISVSINNNG